MLQCYARQKLHRDECLTILLTDVVYRANIGMIQRGRSLGLAPKTGQCLRVAGNRVGQELEGNEAMQPRVLSLINHAHAAAPEFFDNPVVGDGFAEHARYGRWHLRGKSMKTAELAVANEGC